MYFLRFGLRVWRIVILTTYIWKEFESRSLNIFCSGSFYKRFRRGCEIKTCATIFFFVNNYFSVLVVVVGMASKDIPCCDFFLHAVIYIFSEK